MNGPLLYVISAPSGGGKTSLVNALLERDKHVALSVSHTTRSPRPGEMDGVHYYFVDDAAFEELASQGAFLEHARVFDHRYGTGREAVERQLADGYDVLLDIDWQGARQIRDTFSAARTIFILPPSLDVLRKRLIGRGQDSEAVIDRRMEAARAEISHAVEFDFLIINDEFEAALSDLHAIIREGRPIRDEENAKTREILAELLETG
ncbi:MAG: guanylate kinase [Xanthomonadales bacterium]|nr:guanylate kinase [Xanthomonadales bacterium]